MKISELESAIAGALIPMQSEGYRVLGAPTDHAAVGRVFGKGEIRAEYQNRSWGEPTGIGGLLKQQAIFTFAAILELQDSRQKSHPHASDAIEKVLELLTGFNPCGDCSRGLYPVQDGFVGRDEESGVWIYQIQFKFLRTIQTRRAA